MTRTFKRFLMISTVAASFAFTPLAHAAETFTAEQKTEIGNVIKSYLIENPELVYQALQQFQQNQQAKEAAGAEVIIKQKWSELTAKGLPSVGNPDGDVTVVEFFDYNCGYCKRALEDINTVLEQDKNVRFIFKEYPILGPSSEVAARWAEAAHRQGKYFEFHQAVMHSMNPLNEENLEKIGKDVGLDVEKLKTDANSAEVRTSVTDSRNLGMSMHVQGTPGFIINGKFYGGYLGPEGFKRAIDEARKEKK